MFIIKHANEIFLNFFFPSDGLSGSLQAREVIVLSSEITPSASSVLRSPFNVPWLGMCKVY